MGTGKIMSGKLKIIKITAIILVTAIMGIFMSKANNKNFDVQEIAERLDRTNFKTVNVETLTDKTLCETMSYMKGVKIYEGGHSKNDINTIAPKYVTLGNSNIKRDICKESGIDELELIKASFQYQFDRKKSSQ